MLVEYSPYQDEACFIPDEQPAVDPCQPSPCGPNSQCQVVNDSPSCSCTPGFFGSPPSCRPECASNSECLGHLACINQRCQDPCIGSCGANADCRVVSHTPMCTCLSGYTGDPFTQCLFRERKGRTIPSVTFFYSSVAQFLTVRFYSRDDPRAY